MKDLHLPVYLDYHSTTPVDPHVLEEMLPFFSIHFGNPASRSHPFGWKAGEAVEMARNRVGQLLGVREESIIFTSGATEGLNFSIKGLAEKLSFKGKHIITIATEHPAVLDTVDVLAKKGFKITKLPVDRQGHIDIQNLIDAMTNETIMVVAMWANNETGTIHDVKQIGNICSEKNIAFICDATQAVGKLEIKLADLGIDILICSAHKFYGPKGCGAVCILDQHKKLKPDALIHGGGHEKGFRSGTLNVPAIVGMGAAANIARSTFQNDMDVIKSHRDHFESLLKNGLESIHINGSMQSRLPTVSNLKVDYVDSQAVMTKLRTKISISSGSACSSSNPAPSHVLIAMGLSVEEAKSSFRISFGKITTLEEVEFAAKSLLEAIHAYRLESPVWQMYKAGIQF